MHVTIICDYYTQFMSINTRRLLTVFALLYTTYPLHTVLHVSKRARHEYIQICISSQERAPAVDATHSPAVLRNTRGGPPDQEVHPVSRQSKPRRAGKSFLSSLSVLLFRNCDKTKRDRCWSKTSVLAQISKLGCLLFVQVQANDEIQLIVAKWSNSCTVTPTNSQVRQINLFLVFNQAVQAMAKEKSSDNQAVQSDGDRTDIH